MYPNKNPAQVREVVNINVATFSLYFFKKIHNIFSYKIFIKKIEPIVFYTLNTSVVTKFGEKNPYLSPNKYFFLKIIKVTEIIFFNFKKYIIHNQTMTQFEINTT